MEWVSRIFAVALLMILPALGGRWLDQQFGTQFLTLVGILLGVTCGITVLVCLAQIAENQDVHTASSSSETTKGIAETPAPAEAHPSNSELTKPGVDPTRAGEEEAPADSDPDEEVGAG